ncbi:predicted GPI-anchored protein 58 isoform X2 [Oryzias melastigma]|uniref:predicted GPI-anchored protein 58 isoform X2 n=1 Tax=Oryzias melastigma TaxID=30732 RepID=UPI000CF7E01A|nr:predicted GPI-anchored protein 58 isoform X2 [Oryzias melastigma]
MIIILLLSCITLLVSAVPVAPNARPHMLPQGGATQRVHPVQTTNHQPEAQTPAPLAPIQEQTQSGIPQQPDPQAVLQPSPSLPQHTWYPQGGSTPISPLPQNVSPFLPANHLTLGQLPLMFPPYGFYPLFAPPYGNQLFSPYGFPSIREPPFPQAPTQQLQNSPAAPAENVVGAAVPAAAAPQQTQQQNPQIVYMLQQPMNPALGGLSSEELETQAKLNQMSLYSVLTNLPAGVGPVQPDNQAAGLTNPEQQGASLHVGGSAAAAAAAGVRSSLQGPACSGSLLNSNSGPAGVRSAAPEANAVQTQNQAKGLPSHRNLVRSKAN